MQLRAPSGSAFDTWRLSYSANRLLAKENEARLIPLRKALSDNRDWQNFSEQCLSLFDTFGLLKKNLALEMELQRARAEGKKYDQTEGDVRCALRGPTQLQYDVNFYARTVKDLSGDIEEIVTLQKRGAEEYADLVKGRQEYVALKEMENSWSTRLLVATPYELLVLLLVMLMGSLGGVVRLLRDYGAEKNEDPSTRDYFIVPLIGAVVAIGGYVLAKTGLLLLSSTKGETSLSPFMIGLVGMISGLLAKEVIDRIAEYGRSILKKKP